MKIPFFSNYIEDLKEAQACRKKMLLELQQQTSFLNMIYDRLRDIKNDQLEFRGRERQRE